MNSNAGGPFQLENQLHQTSSQQQSSFGMDASLHGSQSKEQYCLHSSCSMSQAQSSCFGSFLRGFSTNSTANQCSTSLGKEVEVSTKECAAAAGSNSHQGGLDAVNDSLGTKMGTVGLAKKPSVPGALKVSPKMNIKGLKKLESVGTNGVFYRNEMKLEEKWVTKGHKRQKSLPKQHYSSVETVGHVIDGSATIVDQGTRCVDTNPVASKTKKSEVLNQTDYSSLSTVKKPVKPPTGTNPLANGHGKQDEQMFEQNDYHSIGKSQSEVVCSSMNGRDVYNGECAMNGHMNGDDYNDSIYHQFSELDACSTDDMHELSEPHVGEETVVLKSSQSGTWKNIFGYFK